MRIYLPNCSHICQTLKNPIVDKFSAERTLTLTPNFQQEVPRTWDQTSSQAIDQRAQPERSTLNSGAKVPQKHFKTPDNSTGLGARSSALPSITSVLQPMYDVLKPRPQDAHSPKPTWSAIMPLYLKLLSLHVRTFGIYGAFCAIKSH